MGFCHKLYLHLGQEQPIQIKRVKGQIIRFCRGLISYVGMAKIITRCVNVRFVIQDVLG